MDPEDFIAWIAKSLNMKYVVVGDDFCFGYKRQGNYKTLLQHQEKYGYTAVVVPKMQDEGRDISSTYIREEIKNGRISKANVLTQIVRYGTVLYRKCKKGGSLPWRKQQKTANSGWRW